MSIVVAAIASTVMIPGVGRASEAPSGRERLEGEWVLALPRAEARRVVDRAVDDAADAFNFFIRGIARSRLRDGTPIHERVQVSFDEDQVTVRFGRGEAYTTKLGRTEVEQTPDGTRVRVTQRLRPTGQLEQVFATPQGTRRYLYTPLQSGRLRVTTTTDSPQMPEPMFFMLDYRRP